MSMSFNTPRRLHVAAAFVALALIPFTASAAGLSRDQPEILPAEMCGLFFLVPMAVDGDPARTLVLLLDTGANHTVIDPDSVMRVSQQQVKSGSWVKFSRLTSGPATFKRLRARAHNLDHISRALGRHIDGILGYPAFADLLLTLDYPAGQVRIQRGRLNQEDDQVMPLAERESKRPWVNLDIVGRQRPVLIDSGSGNGMVLYRSNRYDWLVKPLPVRSSMRINRLELREMGRLEASIPFADTAIVNPLVELTNRTQLMGTAILREFVITFDQKKQLIRLQQDTPGPITPGPLRGTGLVFNPVHAGLEVVRVLKGSPAAEAGVRKGDTLVAINGRSVHERDCGSYGGRLSGADSQALLTLRRQQDEIEVTTGIVDLVP